MTEQANKPQLPFVKSGPMWTMWSSRGGWRSAATGGKPPWLRWLKKKNTILGIKTFCTWVIAAFFEAWWTKKPLQSWNSSHDRTWYFINASNDCWNLSTGSFKAIPPVRRSYGYPRGPIFSRWNQRAVKNSWDLPPVLIWWDMDRYGGFQLAMGVAP